MHASSQCHNKHHRKNHSKSKSKNINKNNNHTQHGGALFYILIAVALLGALTFTITRQGAQEGGLPGQMTDERARILSGDIMNHVTTMRSALQQMVTFAVVDLANVSFVRPSEADFETTPPANGDKLFHPAGGGVPEFTTGTEAYFDTTTGSTGWVYQAGTNVAWSETGASDLIASFVDLHPLICAAVNQRINGSTDIPSAPGLTWEDIFQNGATDTDFTATACPACEGRISLCINNGTRNIFYNVIAQR